jgi:hypothetical protein
MNGIHRRFFIIYILVLTLASCSQREQESLPAGILSKDKMVSVLVAIHLAEAAADNRSLNVQQMNALMVNKYEELFKQHGITGKAFLDSYNYYLEHAALLADIYAEVVNQLTTRESRVDGGHKVPVIMSDSLRNAKSLPVDSIPKN